MNALTGQLAAVMASTDAVPRLVRQFTALFLVTPEGAVWRVFDSDDARGATRFGPTSDPHVCARIFVGSGSQPIVRVHQFKDQESRSVAADRLLEQLTAAKPDA